MASPSSTLALNELIAPLTIAEFRARHWFGGAPFVSQPSQALVEKIRGIDGLASVEALLPKLQGTVRLLGPNAFRSDVPAKVALDFLNRGYNLYFAPVERSVPNVIEPFTGVANELGVPPWQLSVEAFAGRAGGISSRNTTTTSIFRSCSTARSAGGSSPTSTSRTRCAHFTLSAAPTAQWGGSPKPRMRRTRSCPPGSIARE